MPRKPRLVEPGFYHIINRGVEQRSIFLENEDYDFFLDLLCNIVDNYNTTIHTFCLMTNHYHILLETKEENISKSMQYLNNSYTKYFNKKYKRVGHLWQGRFQSYYLYDDDHFWVVAKYIERNPIEANMLDSIEAYKYHSLHQWLHQGKYLSILKNSSIFDMTLKEYINYLSSKLHEETVAEIYKTPKTVVVNHKVKVLTRRLESFFEEDRDINRDTNIKQAYKYGYTKSEIAKFMSLSHTAINKKLKQ